MWVTSESCGRDESWVTSESCGRDESCESQVSHVVVMSHVSHKWVMWSWWVMWVVMSHVMSQVSHVIAMMSHVTVTSESCDSHDESCDSHDESCDSHVRVYPCRCIYMYFVYLEFTIWFHITFRTKTCVCVYKKLRFALIKWWQWEQLKLTNRLWKLQSKMILWLQTAVEKNKEAHSYIHVWRTERRRKCS